MTHPQIQATIEPRGGHRFALVFRNISDREAHLYRPNACEGGRIENNVFEVHAHARIAYTGAYVKRPAPRAEDFIVIPARATRVEDVDLSSAYAVPQGGRYTTRYEAFHGSPEDPNALWEVQSNTAGGGA